MAARFSFSRAISAVSRSVGFAFPLAIANSRSYFAVRSACTFSTSSLRHCSADAERYKALAVKFEQARACL